MNLTEVTSSMKMCSPKRQLLLIEGYVLFTFILMVLLFIHGQVRRRYRGILVKAIGLALNASIPLLISYIFGLIQNLDANYNELVCVWAVFLVVVYACYIDVPNIYDPGTAGLALLKFFVYFMYAIFAMKYIRRSSLAYPLVILLIISEFCLEFRIVCVSLIVGAWFEVKPDSFLWKMLEYSREGHKYVVNPNSIKTKYGKISGEGRRIVTMDKIWSCKDGFILESRGEQSDQLKSTALSFSLFWMLLHKFAGIPLYRSSHHKEEAWRFVRQISYPFRVVEVELSFLYDFFYGRGLLLFLTGFWIQFAVDLVFHGVIGWIVVVLLTNYHPKEQKLRIRYRNYDVDVFATGVVILSIIITQIAQLCILSTSKWSKMRLLCTYINREAWKEQNALDRCIKKAAEIHCLQRRRPSKPRQTKLSQYSLLHGNSNALLAPVVSTALTLFGIPHDRPGRKQSDGVMLSEEIKEAVIRPLVEQDYCERRLSNGSRALECNQDLGDQTKRKLVKYCSQVESDTAKVILMWHIATSMCEMNPELSQTHRDSVDFHVATSLSKYCAYLSAFAPNLLPGHPSTTERTCTMVIAEGRKILRKSESGTHTYEALMNMDDEDGLDADSIFRQGISLGRVLDTEITDPRTRWKVVADVWAERISYLAPNLNNELAHLDRLATGGEFITHLWVLLFHAGIVDRESINNHWDVEASTPTV